ncbi:DNA-3-methyladenine glycosylase [Brachyspira hampsonii]|uniref:DNA-3-methyladenine glycosylase n=1 Tax=Brachyspira hampsonii TaxID=1287055 RepID=A0A1E5NEW6_9SPIR|nr:DNA-3-methyladenine glycosylase I [Brachyspira hampsonii]OEJ14683.1 DNA-3-methyladenine glycosylase [Brachyspira hampsonii]
MQTICKWAKSEIEIKYHNEEWCRICHDERKLFEMLILENMQAGLSWRCILEKRENMRKAFDNFDYKKISKYDEKKIEELLNNKGIIRNKRKINALITNANKFIEVQKEYGSFDKYIWSFTNGKQINNKLCDEDPLPAKNELSDIISKDMIKKGFKFAGSIIIYSYLEAIGIINDHCVNCDFYKKT